MKEKYFIDEKSLTSIEFLKVANIVITVLNAIAILFICVSIGIHKEEKKFSYKPDYNSYTGKMTYEKEEESDSTEKTVSPDELKAMYIIFTIIFGIGYCIFSFKAIEMLTQHFSNVAETKGIQFEMFKQTEGYKEYIKQIEDSTK